MKPVAVWRMATEYPETNISGVGLTLFASKVAERTDGLLHIETLTDNVCGISSEGMVDAAQNGIVNGGDAFSGPLESVDRVFGLSALPFVFQSQQAASAAMAVGRPHYEQALARRGLKLLHLTIWPATGIWSVDPLRHSDDLQGLSARGNDYNSAKVLAAAGANCVYIPFNKAMGLVHEGNIKAIVTSGDGGVSRRLWEHFRHFTAIRYAIPVSIAFVRQSDVEALTPEMRDQVMDAVTATEWETSMLSEDRTRQNYERIQENGVVIADPPPSELLSTLKLAAKPAIADWKQHVPTELATFVERIAASNER